MLSRSLLTVALPLSEDERNVGSEPAPFRVEMTVQTDDLTRIAELLDLAPVGVIERAFGTDVISLWSRGAASDGRRPGGLVWRGADSVGDSATPGPALVIAPFLASAKRGRIRQTTPRDYAVRFVFGGAITVAAGLIGARWGPVVGGLFLAFPSILAATLTMIAKHSRLNRAAGADGLGRRAGKPGPHGICARRLDPDRPPAGLASPVAGIAGLGGGCCRGLGRVPDMAPATPPARNPTWSRKHRQGLKIGSLRRVFDGRVLLAA